VDKALFSKAIKGKVLAAVMNEDLAAIDNEYTLDWTNGLSPNC